MSLWPYLCPNSSGYGDDDDESRDDEEGGSGDDYPEDYSDTTGRPPPPEGMPDLSEGGGDKNTKHQESINDLEFSEEGGGDETKTEEGDTIVDIKDERGTPPAGSSASVLQSLNIQLSVIAVALNSLLLLRLSASV